MTVPALVVPVLNRPDLLTTMLGSLDHPIKRAVIVDNGNVVGEAWVEDTFDVIHLPHNIGVAGAWNLGIKVTPKAPWWLIANSDITFGSGDLAKIEAGIDQTAPMLLLAKGYAAFAITAPAIDLIGFFDENFTPGYFDDNDIEWRARCAGITVAEIETGIKHIGSATIYSDPIYREANDRTFPLNEAYYVRKWGGLPGREQFQTPFDQGGDLRASQPDLVRLRNQAWPRK